MVKQYPVLGLFIPHRRRSHDHWPIVVEKSCDFRFLLFLLNKRNVLEKSTVYFFNPVTFYWSTWTKPGAVIYICVRDFEFTYFYHFSIEGWNSSDSVIYIFSFYYRLWKKPAELHLLIEIWLWSSSVIKIVKIKYNRIDIKLWLFSTSA
jgi:hypothetical protein